MNILLVMDKRPDRGSIQAGWNYVRAGDRLGHVIALYGRPDERFPNVRFATDPDAFDYVVFVIESSLKWMSALRLPAILSGVPRERRAIVDADGMFNEVISVDGYDRNHPSETIRSIWLRHYAELSDKILQPTLEPRDAGVLGVPFYGYEPPDGRRDGPSSKRFDVMHIGHNWWRWREISNLLLPAIEEIRGELDGICFLGSWWDAPPAGASELGLDDAFEVDAQRLRRLRIDVRPPVPYTCVVAEMAAGRVNVMTQRPLFRHLKILTSKYFEIFSADTIPLVMLDPDHAESIYGPDGRELALHGRVAAKLLDALREPEKYQTLTDRVRAHLFAHHSYDVRVRQLVAALEA